MVRQAAAILPPLRGSCSPQFVGYSCALPMRVIIALHRRKSCENVRAAIREEIASIEPFDALERAHVEDALAWIDSGVQVCRIQKPATPPKHLVSYFVLVNQDHVLLVDHKNAQLWLPTGGHVETGEHPRATVMRELREELGLELREAPGAPLMLTIAETVGISAGHTDVSLWYVIAVDRRLTIEFDSAEFHTVQWFRSKDVPVARADPHLQRFLSKLARASGSARFTHS